MRQDVINELRNVPIQGDIGRGGLGVSCERTPSLLGNGGVLSQPTRQPFGQRHQRGFTWLFGWILAGGVVLQSGCQLAQPGTGFSATPSGISSSSFKPQTGTPGSALGPHAANATIRGQSPAPQVPLGQSPAPWNGTAAGSTDAFRSPLPATDASANRYAPQYSTPTSVPGPPPSTVYQPGVPPAGGLTPPPAGQPGPGGVPGFAPGAPGLLQSPSPSDYNAAIAPGVVQGPGLGDASIVPGAVPFVDPSLGITAPGIAGYRPRERIAPIDVYVQEARTGRIIVGGSVNSDLGVAGQIVIDERNADLFRIPRSWDELWSGRAFRGGGQNFRAEIMPGDRVERYTVSWTDRNLRDSPYSLSVGGFLYTRQFRDWTEQRLGGRIALGYEVTKDLSVSSEIRLEDVKLFDPRLAGVTELDDALGSNDIYTARFRVAHDTRDSPFMSTRGGLLELVFDQVFGEYDYSRGNVNYSRYFMVRQRPDGTGRHTIASTWRVGITGSQTPIFENYFAGGYSTMRGFSFRGASPKVGDVQVGGELLMLGSLEYVFPMTADEMLRGVAFVDYGTVEQDLEINSENFRVAPGLGLRISVPALGPAPLAFDFAYPVNHADSDDRQVFSFFMGFTR